MSVADVAPVRVERLTAATEKHFFNLHCPANDAGWCHCVGWWVPTWQGWSERSAEQNRTLREQLFARGEHDGYLLFEYDEVRAWAQFGPRDRLEKLRMAMGLEPDPRVHAISCLLVAPAARGRGLARRLIEGIVADARERGITAIEAYPKSSTAELAFDAGEAWTGTATMFEAAGFVLARALVPRSVYRLEL